MFQMKPPVHYLMFVITFPITNFIRIDAIYFSYVINFQIIRPEAFPMLYVKHVKKVDNIQDAPFKMF